MKEDPRLRPLPMVWLYPPAFLLHLAEEFYGGVGLPAWFSDLFGGRLTDGDFLWINGFGLTFVMVFTVWYYFKKGPATGMVALATLFTLNGLLHGLGSVLTLSYVPGTLTGLILYLPMGYLVYKRLWRQLSDLQRITGVTAAVLIHTGVTGVAWYLS